MQILEVDTIDGIEKALHQLLVDCVNSGASVGFITPIDDLEIQAYWQAVNKQLLQKQRKLFIAVNRDEVLGAVQLSLCSKANGSHRGEVEKLMVTTKARGQGISKKLMHLMEKSAQSLGLTLLVLDTRLGDIASTLYRKLDYIEAGQIPQFARSSNGDLDATVYFYKLLK
ncbi:N-acetyltransferase family protein [Glaciecola sp. 1036]|uniref:GNAT family N-acetyltransferase n=1 Tax=Alteromonadaceae TaxID=72275 RepID=UPI003D05EC65